MKKIITLICLVLLINISRSVAQAWTSMGSGLGVSTEEVKTVAVDPSGNIYVGGTFTGAINYLAKWNGSSWAGLGTGINGPVYSIGIKTASDIYIGGQFTNAGGVTVSNVVRWNGSTFSALGDGFNGKVLCIYTPASGTVYAGGEFSMSGTTPMIHIAKLQGTMWTSMGSGIPANVNTVVEHGGITYAGCDQSSNPVLKWNGSSWTAVSGLTGGKVLSLASFWGYLYAGGDFSQPIRALAKWDGTSWSTAVTNFSFGQRVNVLYQRTDALYVGGNFTGIGIGSPNYIARVTSASSPLLSFTISSELINGEVLAIGKASGKVIAGGKFTTPTTPVTNNVSITNTTIDVNELSNIVVSKNLFPNPAHGKTTLTVNTSSVIKNPVLKIYDVQSKLVQTEITLVEGNNGLTFDIDLGNIPTGNYYYVLVADNQVVTSDMFIVE